MTRNPQDRPLSIYLYFDSLSLWSHLSGSWDNLTDRTSLGIATLLSDIATQGHCVHTCWIPGHSGIAGNEEADRLAGEAAALPQDDTQTYISTDSVKNALKIRVARLSTEHYLQETPPTDLHRRATGGQNVSTSGMTRAESVALRQLRLGRYSRLASTRFKHQWTDSPTCPRCHQEDETSEHFLLRCPRWTNERLATLGPSPSIECLQAAPEDVIEFLRRCALRK